MRCISRHRCRYSCRPERQFSNDGKKDLHAILQNHQHHGFVPVLQHRLNMKRCHWRGSIILTGHGMTISPFLPGASWATICRRLRRGWDVVRWRLPSGGTG